MKVTDQQITGAFTELHQRRIKNWRARFGEDLSPFMGFRRETIQAMVNEKHGVEMSDSGFRSRVKKLVKKGELEMFRMEERIVYYFIKTPPSR